jgi:hypothetical protein
MQEYVASPAVPTPRMMMGTASVGADHRPREPLSGPRQTVAASAARNGCFPDGYAWIELCPAARAFRHRARLRGSRGEAGDVHRAVSCTTTAMTVVTSSPLWIVQPGGVDSRGLANSRCTVPNHREKGVAAVGIRSTGRRKFPLGPRGRRPCTSCHPSGPRRQSALAECDRARVVIAGRSALTGEDQRE